MVRILIFFLMRSNLYWQVSTTNISFAGKTFAQWQAVGEDWVSRIVDPLFVDGLNRDFRLASTGVVATVGFHPFDFSVAGVYGDDAWKAKARVPSMPERLPQPVTYTLFDYCEDFETPECWFRCAECQRLRYRKRCQPSAWSAMWRLRGAQSCIDRCAGAGADVLSFFQLYAS